VVLEILEVFRRFSQLNWWCGQKVEVGGAMQRIEGEGVVVVGNCRFTAGLVHS
jgi:predicted nucleotidyltransferase